MGSTPDTCGCAGLSPTHTSCTLNTSSPGWPAAAGATDDSPRNFSYAAVGAVKVADDDALAGQVIINKANASDDAADLWSGDAVLDEFATVPIVIATGSTTPFNAPYYDEPSTPLGTGAIGLAPFRLYQNDCDPPRDEDGSDDGILVQDMNDGFGTGEPVLVRFYGPIKKKTGAPWSAHLKITALPFDNPGMVGDLDPCIGFDMTAAFNIVGPSTTATGIARRTITLTVKDNNYAGPGIYTVRPVATDSVQCEDVTGNPAAVWPAIACPSNSEYAVIYGYRFVISPDCDLDRIPDRRDSFLYNCSVSCNIGDFNQSGDATVQDVFDFLGAYFGACIGSPLPSNCMRSADVNSSGTITVQDIFDFLAAFFAFGSAGCG